MGRQIIAVLGTGLMGAPMARNLLKAGHAVHAWNRTSEKAQALQGDGAVIFENAADAVAQADIVILLLTDGAAVDELLFRRGVAQAMKRGAIVVDMSSIRPDEARDHAARLAGMEIGHVDAPVSGGTKGAEAATLAIMAGGSQDDFGHVEPVLRAMGRPVLVGPSGSGQLAKLCNQAIVGVTIGVVAEAMLLMERGGGDPSKLREALKGGFADSTILQLHGARMTSGDFEPGGRSSVQLKDLDNIALAMEAAGVNLPLAESLRERFATLVHDLDAADLDHSALYLELLSRNGIDISEYLK